MSGALQTNVSPTPPLTLGKRLEDYSVEQRMGSEKRPRDKTLLEPPTRVDFLPSVLVEMPL